MKRTTTAALAAAACLAAGALATSATPAVAQASSPSCIKMPNPQPVYGNWYKCTDSVKGTTRYHGQVSAVGDAAILRFGNWAPNVIICLDTKFDTGYRPGSPPVGWVGLGSSNLCS